MFVSLPRRPDPAVCPPPLVFFLPLLMPTFVFWYQRSALCNLPRALYAYPNNIVDIVIQSPLGRQPSCQTGWIGFQMIPTEHTPPPLSPME